MGWTFTSLQAVPADAFLAAGATFQSDPGHGVSHEITITFSQPVTAVTVTAYDPTFAGNAMSAYDSAGALIGTVPFPGNNMPGTLTTQVGTLSGAIESVHLVPAPLDYVAYSMTVKFAGGSHRALAVTPTVAGLLAPYVPAITTGICGVDERRSSRVFQILVQDTVGSSVSPVAGQTVSLALSEVPFSGGHIHDAARPPGSFAFGVATPTIDVTTDVAGMARVSYYPPEAAGTYIMTASTPGAPNAVDSVSVGLSLSPLIATANETLVGTTTIHPSNHFATPTMIQGLSVLAESLFVVTGHTLTINDESLESGGVFDLNANWSNPHCTHRDGRSADLHTNGIPRRDSLLITTLWTSMFGVGSAVREATPPHTHVKTPH